MPWVPESERDTGWYIFNQLFQVQIPFAYSRTIEEIQMYGTVDCGTPERNEALRRSMVNCSKNIADLAELSKAGSPIQLVNIGDAKIIYNRIRDHLEAWAEVVSKSVNRGRVPSEDLVTLDNFARIVYPLGGAPMFVDGKLATQSLARILGFTAPVLKTEENKPEEPKTTEDLREEYPSLADRFKRMPAGGPSFQLGNKDRWRS